MTRILFIALASVLFTGPAFADSNDVLYRYSGTPLRTGKLGSIAKFQQALFEKVAACNGGSPEDFGTADGIFGRQTHDAIISLTGCYPYGPQVGASSASEGDLTELLWTLVVEGVAPPDAAQRTRDLTLAFEATDYADLEYNFCQSRNPTSHDTYAQGDAECYSNDPRSFMTWGPRGATAGHGAEIQQVIFAVDKAQPALIDQAFGAEADTVRRLVKADAESIEKMLCAVWLDPQRRNALKSGFHAFGALAVVQQAYDQVYQSVDADGSKIERFYKIYANLKPVIGRDPTEVDYAFFLDRATHGGSPKRSQLDALTDALRNLIQKLGRDASPAEIRWELARQLPVSNQKRDRLGRDVVYVIDGLAILSADARDAWNDRLAVKASDFGLSDERFMATYHALPGSGYASLTKIDVLTPLEQSACPDKVLHPINPNG